MLENPSTYTVVSFQFTKNPNPPRETDAKPQFAWKISSLNVSNGLRTQSFWHMTIKN